MKHKFFKDIDWEAVARKELTPPVIPGQNVRRSLTSGCGEPLDLLQHCFDKDMIGKTVSLYTESKG